jgi:flagellar protein FlaF
MPSNPNNNNPYASAAGAYGQNAQKHTPDQRELEGRVLLKAAGMIKALQEDWDNIDPIKLEETLTYNRQIWMLFYDTALENPENPGGVIRPNDLRSNIINLANFVFKRQLDIMAAPEKQKLDILININREIAEGLLTKPAASAADKSGEKP